MNKTCSWYIQFGLEKATGKKLQTNTTILHEPNHGLFNNKCLEELGALLLLWLGPEGGIGRLERTT